MVQETSSYQYVVWELRRLEALMNRKLTDEQRREGEWRERMQDGDRNRPKPKKPEPHQGWPQSSYCTYDYDGNPVPDEFTRQGPGVYSGPSKV